MVIIIEVIFWNINIIKFLNGSIIIHKIEKPDTNPINITANKTFGPYINKFCANLGFLFAIRLPKICPPSKGYTGNKLNIARLIFICIIK